MLSGPDIPSLDLSSLRAHFAAGLTPAQLLTTLFARLDASPHQNAFISQTPRDLLFTRALELQALPPKSRPPLYGIPFAVKDNIDVAHLPTTAACKSFQRSPAASAHVVDRLLKLGALCLGKTNMDQFATGLTGVLSDFAPCVNPFNSAFISGGSSSGSALATSTGLVSFALGTDTAGSGRVPAGFCNIVGLKPTRGLLSTSGVLPACRSLDCISIFALTAPDAAELLALSKDFDPADIFSRRDSASLNLSAPAFSTPHFRFGVPSPEDLQFHGDAASQAIYLAALDKLASLGGRRVQIDFAPFRDTARLLYQGPWVAERLAALKPFVDSHADSIHPVILGILTKASQYSAVDAFNALYQLQAFRRQACAQWANMDVMVLPTSPTILTTAETLQDPYKASALLGRYTNFANLLDTCALALPAGFRPDGLPVGVTLVAPALKDASILALGAQFQSTLNLPLGTQPSPPPHAAFSKPIPTPAPPPDGTHICVVGAHLTGLPLNHQLTNLAAVRVKACRTAPLYRLYALPNTTPPKPGLIRDTAGIAIEVEVWRLPSPNVAAFLALVSHPLTIGNIILEDGTSVKGFLCEPYALRGAHEISAFGGWRAYLSSLKQPV